MAREPYLSKPFPPEAFLHRAWLPLLLALGASHERLREAAG